jgi:hypothetical protein
MEFSFKDEKIISKWIIEKHEERCGSDSSLSG